MQESRTNESAGETWSLNGIAIFLGPSKGALEELEST